MEQREERSEISLSRDFDEGDEGGAQGVKRFSECNCDRPIIEPISYVLPDNQFISLLHCTACNGLERYTITELPDKKSDSDNDEEGEDENEDLGAVEALLDDIAALKEENERLQEKLRSQGYRMRLSQNRALTGKEDAVVSPDEGAEGEEASSGEGVEDQKGSIGFGGPELSDTGRKALLASLVLGVGVVGATVWRMTTLSGVAVVLGIWLIIIPVFFLTDGEIPRS
jgi:hypothetical protein